MPSAHRRVVAPTPRAGAALVLLVALVLAAAVGCAPDDLVSAKAPKATTTTTTAVPATAAAGTSDDRRLTTPDGRTRTHHVYAASSLRGTGIPARLLVVALHGGGGTGQQFERDTGLDGWAEANGAVVVYPDGTGGGSDGSTFRTWNGGGCCGVAASQRVDDVEYVRLLIEQLRAEYTIDPGHVVAVGYANGGMLAYRLACELSASISAIGVQSSTFERETCTPDEPVAVLHIHGTGDRNLPIDGGVGDESSQDITFNSPREGIKILASADVCAPQATETASVDTPGVVTRRWSPCAGGTSVAMIEVDTPSHAWMGPSPSNDGGSPEARLDSTAVLWQFTASHAR